MKIKNKNKRKRVFRVSPRERENCDACTGSSDAAWNTSKRCLKDGCGGFESFLSSVSVPASFRQAHLAEIPANHRELSRENMYCKSRGKFMLKTNYHSVVAETMSIHVCDQNHHSDHGRSKASPCRGKIHLANFSRY